MKDDKKTKQRLITELDSLKKENEELKAQAHRYLQIDEELTHSENFYRTLFENSGTATIVIEEDTTVSMINSDFANFTGYSRDEIVGQTWTKYVAQDDINRLLEYHKMRRQDSAAAPRNYEFKIRNKDGGTLNIFMTIAMIPGTTQSIASMVDITERIKAENALRDSEELFRQLVETMN